VSDWVDSGGNAPHFCTDDEEFKNLELKDLELRDLDHPQRRRAGRLKAPLTIGFAAALVALASHLGHARDRGQ
jgi:hypothetical protein